MNSLGAADLKARIGGLYGRTNGCHVAHPRVRRSELLLLLLLLRAAIVGGAGGSIKRRSVRRRCPSTTSEHLFGDGHRLKIITGVAAAAAEAAADHRSVWPLVMCNTCLNAVVATG